MIIFSAVNSKLLFEINKRIGFMRCIEIFIIFAMRTLNLAIVPWYECFDELMPDAKFFRFLFKQMKSDLV